MQTILVQGTEVIDVTEQLIISKSENNVSHFAYALGYDLCLKAVSKICPQDFLNPTLFIVHFKNNMVNQSTFQRQWYKLKVNSKTWIK